MERKELAAPPRRAIARKKENSKNFEILAGISVAVILAWGLLYGEDLRHDLQEKISTVRQELKGPCGISEDERVAFNQTWKIGHHATPTTN
tara:strand:+ start:1398 stop:1670 length:273 start_codon:yes stop_codon:yes gene_type:complete